MDEQQRLYRLLNQRFVKAMATYHLLADGDRVLVGLSGGKDSLLLTELLAKRSLIHHPRFEVEAVHVKMENVSYASGISYLQSFCDQLHVRLHVVTTRFETIPDGENSDQAIDGGVKANYNQMRRKQKQPCFLCSWYRRKALFNLAQQLGCNKIALGHHRDDFIHTALMNLFYQGRFDTMAPKLDMRRMPLAIIRPLCLIDETDISHMAELNHYEKPQRLCPYEHLSQRDTLARMVDEMERVNPEVRHSIWRAIEAQLFSPIAHPAK